MPHKKQQRLYCELSVLAAVSKLAEDKGMTLSDLINTALKEYLERQ